MNEESHLLSYFQLHTRENHCLRFLYGISTSILLLGFQLINVNVFTYLMCIETRLCVVCYVWGYVLLPFCLILNVERQMANENKSINNIYRMKTAVSNELLLFIALTFMQYISND